MASLLRAPSRGRLYRKGLTLLVQILLYQKGQSLSVQSISENSAKLQRALRHSQDDLVGTDVREEDSKLDIFRFVYSGADEFA